MRTNSGLGAYILIALGVFFLLSNLGLIPVIGLPLKTWWPLILIIIGVSSLVRHSSHEKGNLP